MNNLLIRLLRTMLSSISPLVRQGIDDVVLELFRKAKTTDNGYDDLFVECIAWLLGVHLPEID